MKTDRENGFYFVKVNDNWMIALWTEEKWFEIGSLSVYSDSDYQEIDESRIIRTRSVTLKDMESIKNAFC